MSAGLHLQHMTAAREVQEGDPARSAARAAGQAMATAHVPAHALAAAIHAATAVRDAAGAPGADMPRPGNMNGTTATCPD